ncbi:hypothetical protein C0991_002561 [Blastosporella zonata]|nr:hypothetical protein C0991_002561 [Blastosporella zonata]
MYAELREHLKTTFIDLENADDDALIAATHPNTKLICVESPTNPTLRLIDIARISSVAHIHLS